ncbi:acyl transferase/acyl hydrolase/lysophospholipase [Flagelloscypha sp. PMI_526]|nr:acyl transferase/acyl hydrolase/lysophospholipase [Flagelloscypha sp. PMI_526]
MDPARQPNERMIRILLIDGENSARSGVLSPLEILRETMQRVGHDQFPEGSDCSASETSSETSSLGGDEALPCNYFDLIVGSGDGGWVAAMLGRLGMSVSQTIRAYKRMHSELHHSEKNLTAKERTVRFETMLKELAQTRSTNSNSDEKFRIRGSKSMKLCRTFVLTMPPLHLASPILLRTYRARKHRCEDCSIVQAIRAATAVPALFETCRIGEQEYIAASQTGYCNPIETARAEAETVFPDAKHFCIVSLGSGHPGHISLSATDNASVTTIALRLAKDAERKAEEFESQLNAEETIYFRFNVEQGLQEYERADQEGYSEAVIHTRAYCRRREVDIRLEAVVQHLLSSQVTPQVKTDDLGGSITRNALSVIPEPPRVIHLNVSSKKPAQIYINELYNLGLGLPLWDPQRLYPQQLSQEIGLTILSSIENG